MEALPYEPLPQVEWGPSDPAEPSALFLEPHSHLSFRAFAGVVRARVEMPPCNKRNTDIDSSDFSWEIPLLEGPIDELPFPPDFFGFNLEESEYMWRCWKLTQRRVEGLTDMLNTTSLQDRAGRAGGSGVAGSTMLEPVSSTISANTY